jgi:hypothetical protein
MHATNDRNRALVTPRPPMKQIPGLEKVRDFNAPPLDDVVLFMEGMGRKVFA